MPLFIFIISILGGASVIKSKCCNDSMNLEDQSF